MKVLKLVASTLFPRLGCTGSAAPLCVLATLFLSLSQAAKAENLVDFQRDIAPLFVARCLECHGPETAKNDFRVDDRDALLVSSKQVTRMPVRFGPIIC